ncbi:response regulator [Pseudomonas sp. UBA2684]|uniref:response regulator n=1 Tax=Pseudomonas sp. UBA2684 TaxID=1947311 RepID=UPI000E9B1D7D|nr:response regulator transcription factor [Pseudomonas sp. UBA2684]HBX53800.1 DNA-binding response regulator [Pseudomonas sp.]|tara:strand:- start:10632 stop:11300 length:669 start_codon:yes stop_codon:yes gene_type:complete
MNDKIRIGIVDDHPLLRQGVAATLKKVADFDVVEQGGSADEARDIAARCLPDVLLMDVNMPGDTFAAVRAISKSQPSVKIMMLTVSESEDDAYAALEGGAQGYVLKGVSGPDLVQAIRNVAKGETFITPAFASRLLSHFRKHESEKRGVDLTHREEQIIREVAKGLTNREVAAKLSLSEKTVKYYMTNVMQKLHARNRVEAVTAVQRYWEAQKNWRLDIHAP